MAHCCPNCKEAAPILFGKCPECGFFMKDCLEGNCNHTPKTMGEKYLLEHGECYCCGEKKGVCECFTS